MKNVLKKVGLVVGAAGAFVASSAHAALDTAAAAAIASVSGSMTDLLPAMYTAMGIVTGGFVVFGLIKKGIRKVA
jgi:hypothetical protein